MAVEVDRRREAYVGIVPGETAGDAIVCPLNERAEIVGEPATGKEARLLEREIVVGAEMRCSTARLSGFGMGICRRLEHHREWRPRPIAAV